MGIVTDGDRNKKKYIHISGHHGGMFLYNGKDAEEKTSKIDGIEGYLKEMQRVWHDPKENGGTAEPYWKWILVLNDPADEEPIDYHVEIREGIIPWVRLMNLLLNIENPDLMYIAAFRGKTQKKSCTVFMKNAGDKVAWKYDISDGGAHASIVPPYGTEARTSFFREEIVKHYPQLTGRVWSAVNIKTPETKPVEYQVAKERSQSISKNETQEASKKKCEAFVVAMKKVTSAQEFLDGWAGAMKFIKTHIVDPVHSAMAIAEAKAHFTSLEGSEKHELHLDGTYSPLDDDDLPW